MWNVATPFSAVVVQVTVASASPRLGGGERADGGHDRRRAEGAHGERGIEDERVGRALVGLDGERPLGLGLVGWVLGVPVEERVALLGPELSVELAPRPSGP